MSCICLPWYRVIEKPIGIHIHVSRRAFFLSFLKPYTFKALYLLKPYPSKASILLKFAVLFLAVLAPVCLGLLVSQIEYMGKLLLDGSNAARVLALDYIGNLFRKL